MEFLAESIGLLDMDNGGGGGPPPATPAPQKPADAEQTETEKTTTPVLSPFSLSLSLFSPWGSTAEVEEVGSEDQTISIDNGGRRSTAANVDAIRINSNISAPPPTPPTASFYTPNKKKPTDLIEEEPDDLGAMRESISSFDHHSLGDSLLSNVTPDRYWNDSAHSLTSPMTPPSPLTLSVSSSSLRLNFPPSFLFDNTEKYKGGSTVACIYCNDPDLYTLCHCNRSRKEDDNLATTASAPSNAINGTTQAVAEAQTPSSTATIHSNEQYHTNIDNTFTKHVTQRIDARTNYNCFTGTVDAVTGHLLYGTMLYQQHQQQQLTALETATSEITSPTKIIAASEQSAITPMVYTGPFLTNYNTHDSDTDETPLKHGPNGECQYSNGYAFKGIYEYDIPKYGVWSGDGWRYEGGLVIVSSTNNDDSVRRDVIRSRSSSNGSILSTASTSSSNVGLNSSVIGIPHPLPGNVFFDGNGTFTRFHPNDNGKQVLVYKGEFYNGLAHGVGKETNGTGGTTGGSDDDDFFVSGDRRSMGSTYYVYNGEFSNGLRHGVGTLKEDVYYYSEESDSEDDNEKRGKRELDEEECSCVCLSTAAVADFECGGEYYCDVCLTDHFDDEGCKDRLLRNEELLENNNLESNNLGQTTNIDPGPDAAAGGSTPLVTTPPIANTAPEEKEEESIRTTNATTTQPAPPTHQPPVCKICKGRGLRRPKRIRTKKKQQRISSGIWCAGQCEIEDCRGTVNPISKEFTEEESNSSIVAAASKAVIDSSSVDEEGAGSSKIERNDSSTSNLSGSMRRTTWDMLDEKWLGI